MHLLKAYGWLKSFRMVVGAQAEVFPPHNQVLLKQTCYAFRQSFCFIGFLKMHFLIIVEVQRAGAIIEGQELLIKQLHLYVIFLEVL